MDSILEALLQTMGTFLFVLALLLLIALQNSFQKVTIEVKQNINRQHALYIRQ